MRRTLAAAIFILGIIGQAWASACICDDVRPVHSCCKPKVEKHSYLSAKGCCGSENCVVDRTTPPAAGLAQPAIAAHYTVAVTPAAVRFTIPIISLTEPVRGPLATGRYRNWPRPPDLYVRHHAFLI